MMHNSKTGRSARPASGMRCCIAWRIAYIFIAIALLSPSAHARYVQQGPKLVGTPTTGAPQQGIVGAISGDGNTAIVGAPGDGVGVGAAFIFARNNGLWVQQAKLVGTNTPGNTRPEQGISVAISADGNTAVIGGPFDDPNGTGTYVGAVWVFVRNGPAWTQQGAKLVGSNPVGSLPLQGAAVALSADGNTIATGGYGDAGTGAVWIFVRNGRVGVSRVRSSSAPAPSAKLGKGVRSRSPRMAIR